MAFILLDNNLSPKISKTLILSYADIHHVMDVGLESESDSRIWEFVKARSGVIITKDADFFHLLNRYGHPPKVIWIRRGNTTTLHLIQLLENKYSAIQQFMTDPDLGLLELY